jgi:hypothetical protein
MLNMCLVETGSTHLVRGLSLYIRDTKGYDTITDTGLLYLQSNRGMDLITSISIGRNHSSSKSVRHVAEVWSIKDATNIGGSSFKQKMPRGLTRPILLGDGLRNVIGPGCTQYVLFNFLWHELHKTWTVVPFCTCLHRSVHLDTDRPPSTDHAWDHALYMWRTSKPKQLHCSV